MTDDKSVEVKSHELSKITHMIVSEGMILDEQFQVAVIIDKLPLVVKSLRIPLGTKPKSCP